MKKGKSNDELRDFWIKDGKQKTARVSTILRAYKCQYFKEKRAWKIYGIKHRGAIYERLKEIGLKLIPCNIE